jgi:hypothetical protein
MKTTTIRLNHAGTVGDTIQISDARGITYRFQIDHQDHRHTDPTCLPVQIGKSPAETANNLYRKLRPLLAIFSTIDAGGTMSLEQDYPGDVQAIEVTGDTFEVSAWQ